MVITYIIIGITLVISYLAFNDTALFHRYLFNPYIINHQRQWYRFFSHAFIHANYLHLLFNIYTLYLFGQIMEPVFRELFGAAKGTFYYALLYVGAIMISSFPSFEKHKENMHYNAVGASGAVSAVVFAYILINPAGGIGFLFLPFYIPCFLFGALYLIYSWQMAKRGADNIGHDAHFWGAVFGIIFTVALKFQLLGLFVEQVKDYFNSFYH